MKRYNKMIAAVLGAMAITAAAPAQAATATEDPAEVVVSKVIEDDIMWFEASVPTDQDGILRTKVFAPTSGGARRLWQVCTFGTNGPGRYRCGIDVAEGSHAREKNGTWMVKVFVGRSEVARLAVSL